MVQALRKRALRHPDTSATRLGLQVGKHGWVKVTFDGAPALARLEKWVDESYRAVAGAKKSSK